MRKPAVTRLRPYPRPGRTFWLNARTATGRYLVTAPVITARPPLRALRACRAGRCGYDFG